MKTKEQIQERIEYHTSNAAVYEEGMKQYGNNLQQKIMANIGNPKYISEWIDSWLEDIKGHEAQMNEELKIVEVLKWALE